MPHSRTQQRTFFFPFIFIYSVFRFHFSFSLPFFMCFFGSMFYSIFFFSAFIRFMLFVISLPVLKHNTQHFPFIFYPMIVIFHVHKRNAQKQNTHTHKHTQIQIHARTQRTPFYMRLAILDLFAFFFFQSI